MVWFDLPTVKLCVTWDAGLYVALPPWSAVIVQVPTPTSVTVLPESVQTAGVVDANATARPELAVAETANGGSPNARLASAPKVMVWLALVTVNACETVGAGL